MSREILKFENLEKIATDYNPATIRSKVAAGSCFPIAKSNLLRAGAFGKKPGTESTVPGFIHFCGLAFIFNSYCY